MLEEGHGFLLEVLLHRRQVDPSANSLSIKVGTVAFEDFVDDLSCPFELTDVPQECGCRYQITIIGHFLALVHRKNKSVDRLLVNISAPLVVEDERLRRSILDLTAVLHSGKLSDRFVYVTFVEDTEGFPENEGGILTFLKFLIKK